MSWLRKLMAGRKRKPARGELQESFELLRWQVRGGAAAEEQARREQQILDAVDQVALAYSDHEKGDAELARLTAVWATFTNVAPESATKFENALGHARAALDARRRDAAAAAVALGRTLPPDRRDAVRLEN